MKSSRAFSIVELFVVVAVIAVLTSLLLPTMAAAKTRVQGTACLSNLRQWGVATALYVAENNDFLPPEGVPNPSERSTNVGWYIQLPKQLNAPAYHEMPWRTNAAIDPGRSLWICPANPRRSNGKNLFHYCLNEHVNGTGRGSGSVKMSAIRKPIAVPWLFDSKNLPAVGYWSFVHTNLHRQGAQLLFVDGHARWFRKTDYWDLRTGRGRTNNPELTWMP
ncbi:MAG: type II secretion system protein [Verrucomicrobia bacterium]|nr:type II secretion system protein [Verrucomicrobiota bacterium]